MPWLSSWDFVSKIEVLLFSNVLSILLNLCCEINSITLTPDVVKQQLGAKSIALRTHRGLCGLRHGWTCDVKMRPLCFLVDESFEEGRSLTGASVRFVPFIVQVCKLRFHGITVFLRNRQPPKRFEHFSTTFKQRRSYFIIVAEQACCF